MKRSDKTALRAARVMLNHALLGFRMLEDGPAKTTPAHPRAYEWNSHVQSYARTMVRLIREELKPRRARASSRREPT
jgi:hypothetical protein